jgi:hypothetical protein
MANKTITTEELFSLDNIETTTPVENDNLISTEDLFKLGKVTSSTIDPTTASDTELESGDGSLVYEFRTEGDKAAWGKSTDGGVTFEVVDGGNIPDDWFKDPKFKNVYEQQTGLKAKDFKKEPDNRGWFAQAMDAGAVNADLYDNADAIFDIRNTDEARNLSNSELQAYIDLVIKSKTASSEMEELNKFTTAFEKYNQQGENWLTSTIMAVKENGGVTGGGMKGFAQASIQSYRSMINKELLKEAAAPTLGAAGASSVLPVVGTLTAGTTALFTSLNYGLETINTFNTLLEEEIANNPDKYKDGFTPESIRMVMADDEARSRIKRQARARGRTIATVEGVTNVIGIKGSGAVLKAGKNVTSTAGKAGVKTAAGTTAAGAEIIGGGTGEYLGEKVIGRDASGVEIVLEGLSMAAIKAPIDVTVASIELAKNRPNYQIEGTKVSKQAVEDYVNKAETAEEIANLNVKIDNDDAFAKVIHNKIVDTQLETQVNERIEDPSDRQKMVDLEKQRIKAEADTKKKGIQAVPGAKETLESIEMQMNEIVGKYTAIDGRATDVRARKKKAQDVRTRLDEISMEATRVAAAKNTATIKKQMEAVDKKTGRKGQVVEMSSEDIAESQAETTALYGAEVENYKQKLNSIKDKKSQEYKNTQNDLENAKQKLNDHSTADTQFGYIVDYSDGSYDIVLNKDKPMIGTAAHEFQHRILARTLKNNQDIQDKAGKAVTDYVIGKFGGVSPAFINRMSAYINPKTGEQVSEFGEEIITVMSESILDGSLKYNENLFTKVGDVIRQTLQRVGAIDIKFDTGRDIYNFIKDYNRSIEKDYVSKSIVRMAAEGAEGRLVEGKVKTEPTMKMSKDASDNVQRIYEEQGEAGAMDIIDAFKPITSKLVERRSQAPNFDRQLLTDEIETGQRGIFDLIREYKPDSGVPLAAYINKFLPARAIEASQRVLGEEFTQDVTEAKTIAAEEVTTEVKTKPKKKKIVLADRLGVKSKVDKAIKAKLPKLNVESLNFKTLKDQAPEITGEMFGISPKKLISGANITKGELQSAQMFINKNADLLMKMLPEGATAGGTATGIPNTLLKAFYTKTDRAKMAKTGTKAGLAIQVKNDIKKTDFLETFGIINGKPVRTDRNTSARVLALANQTGKMMTNQAVREQLMKDNTPLIAENLTRISDGKSSIMFSKETPSKQEAVFGGITSLLGNNEAVFYEKLPEFVSEFVGINESKMTDKQKNEILLTNDKEALKIALNKVYKNEFDSKTIDDISDRLVKIISNLKIPKKPKKILKETALIEGIIKSIDSEQVKVSKYTDSDVTAAKAQDDLVKQELRRKSDAVHFVNKFNKNNEQAIADLIMLGGSSFTSAKIGDGRGQFYKNSRDYYNYHLSNVDIEPVYNKNGSLNIKATAKKNGLKDIPVTKAAQSSSAAIKDHKNPKSLKERRKHEKHARKVLNEYIKFNVDRYKAGDQDNVDIMLMMNSLLSNMNSVLARAAALKYIEPGIKAANARYEHMQPRVAVLIKLVDAHINRGGIENIDNFLANYDIAIINKKFDKAITDAGYQSTLAEGQSLDDSSLLRYYNDKTLTDNRIEILTEVGTNKVPKVVESFMKGNDLLKSKIKEFNKLNKSIMFSRSTNESKGITVLDFDDTLATTKSLVKFTKPDGTTGTLNAEQYANTYEDLLDQGYTFDFSDFNKVVKGKLAPLFQKALKLQGKFGPENMFVLTARPPAAQKAIFDFLKANGLNIPLKNITGLGNSTSEAKALWIADKVGEGYNDFYFADDALQNVQAVKNMLDQFDVKSKVQQAKVKFSKDMNTEFNSILEDVTKIDASKRFSEQKARKRGASKGKFRLFIPPSHEDFVGLLYNFMGKGKKGDQHRDFFEQALVRPLNRAYREIDAAKQAIANDYKELNKQFTDVKKKLRKKTPDGDYIFEDAVRVYLWNKHGYDIPGLSKTDQTNLSELVMSDPQLQAYAETLNVISKQDTYVDPGKGWDGGNIKTDLIDATGRVGRAEYFTEFNENADIIFSPENLNKIEAAYGRNFRSAVKDILHRIKTGVNRPEGQSGTTNAFMNYLNGSVGTVMFFNVRSAILQQMSIVNYINFADNNIFAAGKAFANQPQYWKDFAFIFNSDMLKQRRGGIGTDINGNDLAQAVAGSKNPTKIVVSKLLKLGFLPTQIGDNIAIATGGATFYRNRINKYIKDGLSKKEAETKAFTDFQDLTQSTQQSSRPDMTSQQQASWIGKLVLNFQNITSQYNRIIKKAALDIGKGRISPPYTTRTQSNLGNLSKILYYGAIQNVIFYSLQTALFAVMFDDDEDEDQILKKKERVIQGSIDSILRGAGIYGAVVSTLKNAYIKFKEQREKNYNKDESAVPLELANFSPVVGIKLRQLVNAEKTLNYNENVISEMETFEADNPQWSAVTNYTQALTNFPANRLYQKSINMRNALDKDYTNFQRVLFFSGYTTWSLGLGDNERIIEAKEKAKINKKNTKKKTKRKKTPAQIMQERRIKFQQRR